jgi:protease I
MTDSKQIAFVIAPEGTERVELTDPWKAIQDAGHQPVLLSTASGEAELFDHLDRADTIVVDALVQDVSIDDYDTLVLPGGVANPDALRLQSSAVKFIGAFVESGKPVAAICHAPWTLVEADVVRGRRLTSWPSLETDIRNAGGSWRDAEVVVDNGLVTSRKPDDLGAFCAKLVEEFTEGRHTPAGAQTQARA